MVPVILIVELEPEVTVDIDTFVTTGAEVSAT